MTFVDNCDSFPFINRGVTQAIVACCEFMGLPQGTPTNRSERPKVEPRSATVLEYGEHRRFEIGEVCKPGSRFVGAPEEVSKFWVGGSVTRGFLPFRLV